MYFSTLSEWLAWISSLSTAEIKLGLERVKIVAQRLNILPPPCPVIIVGGTNGKGSTVAGLESIYRAANYRVGAFTSPYLFRHNEQVRINGQEASDEELCLAYTKIDSARGDIELTPFEFCTLAALVIFQHHLLEIWILEVGLGGRLDAVNIVDADVAITTSISIDHVEWLGPTREAIAYEKAGIYRPHQPAICGDFHPPKSLSDYAAEIGAPFYCQGKTFSFAGREKNWSWQFSDTYYADLPYNGLALQNMSTALMAITLLQHRLPVSREAIMQGLKQVQLMGRLQTIEGPIVEIYDVSHNPASVALLADHVKTMSCRGRTHAVFSMLVDKDIAESIRLICGQIDTWYIASLNTKRAIPSQALLKFFHEADINMVTLFSSIEEAYDVALYNAKPGDRIVIFGSFHTVAEVWKHRENIIKMKQNSALF